MLDFLDIASYTIAVTFFSYGFSRYMRASNGKVLQNMYVEACYLNGKKSQKSS